MTLSEQSAIMLFAGRHGCIQPLLVRQWALAVIEATPQPLLWIIELATTPLQSMDDAFPTLEAHSSPLSFRK